MTGPPESAQGLWYDPNINRFIDEGGYILHDLHQYFDTWQLDEWKKTMQYRLMQDKQGDWWELFYPNSKEDICQHQCERCQTLCEIFHYLRDWQKEEDFIKIRKEIFI